MVRLTANSLASRALLGAGVAVTAGLLFGAARLLGGDLGVLGIPEPVVRGAGHFTVYGTLAVATATVLGRRFLLAWLVIMVLATVEELHQLVVPYRWCSMADWSINAAGITLGLTTVWLLAAWRGQGAGRSE